VKGLLDSSVFIGRERARPVGRLPDEAAISVMTLAELYMGVLVADDPDVRALRLRTLSDVERTFDPLPVDTEVARTFADIVARARRAGLRPKVVDALIAATATTAGLPLFTQDADFERMHGVRVVRV
jgi:predicted nucleic acid-binding protein